MDDVDLGSWYQHPSLGANERFFTLIKGGDGKWRFLRIKRDGLTWYDEKTLLGEMWVTEPLTECICGKSFGLIQKERDGA